MTDAWAQGIVDMAAAVDQGLYNTEPRTPQSTTPPASASGARKYSSQPSWPEPSPISVQDKVIAGHYGL